MMQRPLLSALVCLQCLFVAQPASAQHNALDLHLQHQLWTRLQDHQNQSRLGGQEDAGQAGDTAGAVMVAETGTERSLFAHLIGLREAMVSTLERSAALASGIPNMPADLAATWEAAVWDTYDPHAMMAAAITVFAQQMTSEAEAEVIAFLQTPIGQELRDARQAFRELPPQPYESLLEREQALARSDPRLHGLYFDLGAAIQGDPDFADVGLLLRALLTPAYGEALADDYAASFIETARATLPNGSTIYAMQLLPEASEDRLSAILDFYRSPAGQQWAKAEAAIYPAVIQSRIEALAAEMIRRSDLP